MNGGILSVKAVCWFFVKDWPTHWHTLNISVSQQKQEERNQMSVTCKKSRHAVVFDFNTFPWKKMLMLDSEETVLLLAMLQKEVMASGKALKISVYVCVGHLKCLRISLVVHYNLEQCDRKHIHNLKSPSEEYLSLIFIFQCVLLSRIMHVGWNIIGEIMGVHI